MQCSSLEIREGGNKGNLDSKAQVSVLETIQDFFYQLGHQTTGLGFS